MSYINPQELRVFEDNIGWKILIEKNKIIGKFLDFTPEIEWMVGNNDGSCFHPKSCGFHDVNSQKIESERWLREQRERFPNGWVIRDGNDVIKREYYPNFHLDWNHLMEAVRRLNEKGFNIVPNTDIFNTWKLVFQNCNL